MQSSYGFAPSRNPQYGWNTTSKDYHSHISRIERMPSVLNEVPHYPNVHKAFNNNYNYGDQEGENSTQQQQQRESPSNAKAQKKVQVTERVEVVQSAKDHNDDGDVDKNCDVREDSVDGNADSFIQRKRKGFELCKWKTFKLN